MKYQIKINGCLWDGGDLVLDGKEEVVKFFDVEIFSEDDFIFDDGVKMSIKDGVDYLIGEYVKCYNQDLFEYGDDYCEVGVIEVK